MGCKAQGSWFKHTAMLINSATCFESIPFQISTRKNLGWPCGNNYFGGVRWSKLMLKWNKWQVEAKCVCPNKKYTLPETNIAPETLGLEDEFPFGARSPGRCYVGFGECKWHFKKNKVKKLQAPHFRSLASAVLLASAKPVTSYSAAWPKLYDAMRSLLSECRGY